MFVKVFHFLFRAICETFFSRAVSGFLLSNATTTGRQKLALLVQLTFNPPDRTSTSLGSFLNLPQERLGLEQSSLRTSKCIISTLLGSGSGSTSTTGLLCSSTGGMSSALCPSCGLHKRGTSLLSSLVGSLECDLGLAKRQRVLGLQLGQLVLRLATRHSTAFFRTTLCIGNLTVVFGLLLVHLGQCGLNFFLGRLEGCLGLTGFSLSCLGLGLGATSIFLASLGTPEGTRCLCSTLVGLVEGCLASIKLGLSSIDLTE